MCESVGGVSDVRINSVASCARACCVFIIEEEHVCSRDLGSITDGHRV